MSFPCPIGHFPSSHSFWYHQNSDDGRLTYPNCHHLSNATLDEIQFREQCTKWIKTNVEYLQGLTGEQLALWKLHYKLDLQQHINDKVFLAQIADQKAKTTTWKEMYELDYRRHDRQKQMDRRLQERQDAAEARELHWEATNIQNLDRFITCLHKFIILPLQNLLNNHLLQQYCPLHPKVCYRILLWHH